MCLSLWFKAAKIIIQKNIFQAFQHNHSFFMHIENIVSSVFQDSEINSSTEYQAHGMAIEVKFIRSSRDQIVVAGLRQAMPCAL